MRKHEKTGIILDGNTMIYLYMVIVGDDVIAKVFLANIWRISIQLSSKRKRKNAKK